MLLPLAAPRLFDDDTPVLLVLLPSARTEAAERALAATGVALVALQRELGTAIRVLRLDEATHPAVVRSLDGRGLPAFLLLRRGVELWHQQGLPEGAGIAALLLSKLGPVAAGE